MDTKPFDQIGLIESIFNSLPFSYVFWKNRDGIYMGASANQLKMFDSGHGFIGRTIYEVLDDYESAKAVDNIDNAIMQTGIPQILEESVITPNGEKRIFLSQKQPLKDAGGNIIGLIGFSIDITEKKKIENDLIGAKEKAEASSYIMTEFISNMGHMLVTPFSSISGMASMLLYGYGDKYLELKPLFEELLRGCSAWEKVYQEVIRATSISEIEVKVESFSINHELKNIESILKPSAYAKKLKFMVKPFNSNEGDLIETDRLKFHLILIELISNAIKFTENGRVIVSVNKKNGTYFFQVADTGRGIPEDKMDFIFEQYTMLSRANKYGAQFHGVGAGLFLAKQRAKLINASIQVDSTEGKGATFTLIMPEHYGSIGG
ncbi:PAS domain-containing protein [Legionella sp. km535]|uniref:PAS domain-containing sensor histidine kinase n=1 Tax=Legionella sp. km535 TaxID=2498107 RepID=UPI000F8DBF65|nr:ATP-binding protein [Legionella sp. km535]RUR17963.1 PAS domain-containing protein [Legionella sp. km535]